MNGADPSLNCLIVGYGAPSAEQREILGENVELLRVKVPFSDSRYPKVLRPLIFASWTVLVGFQLLRKSPALIIAHSLAALPVSVFLSKFLRAPLLYDAHELETHRNGWTRLMRRLGQLTERNLIGYASEVIVVSESIAQWYRTNYRLRNVTVVRNVPDLESQKSMRDTGLRALLGLTADQQIALYLGRIGPGRGLRQIIAAAQYLPSEMHIVVMGDGLLAADIAALISDSSNIHLLPAVSEDAVISTASEATIGFCLIEETCLSYRYSLPNKLFEYMHAGLQIIASDLPEIRSTLERHKTGQITEIEPQAISNAILRARDLRHNPFDKANLQFDTWAAEKDIFLAVVTRTLPAGSGHRI